jgi:hypothetical protein
MDDKLSRIQKPLAIVAIFAGIVQISGIAVLPYIKGDYQFQLIWFLISFPVLMVILFFVTINYYIRVISKQNDLLMFSRSGRKLKPSNRYEIGLNEMGKTNNSIKPKTIADEESTKHKITKTIAGHETEITGEKYRRMESTSEDKITWK